MNRKNADSPPTSYGCNAALARGVFGYCCRIIDGEPSRGKDHQKFSFGHMNFWLNSGGR